MEEWKSDLVKAVQKKLGIKKQKMKTVEKKRQVLINCLDPDTAVMGLCVCAPGKTVESAGIRGNTVESEGYGVDCAPGKTVESAGIRDRVG